MLCIGASVMAEPKAKLVVKTWLDTPYAGGRHQSRVDKVKKIEDDFLKPVY
jgi:ribose 5-phosphate isomerase B